MRPQLCSPSHLAELLDELQSLLLQHDSQSYNRQDSPVNGPHQSHLPEAPMSPSAPLPDPMTPGSSQPEQSAAQRTGSEQAHVPAGRLSGQARKDRLASIKEQIAAGTYDTDELLELALQRMIQTVDG